MHQPTTWRGSAAVVRTATWDPVRRVGDGQRRGRQLVPRRVRDGAHHLEPQDHRVQGRAHARGLARLPVGRPGAHVREPRHPFTRC